MLPRSVSCHVLLAYSSVVRKLRWMEINRKEKKALKARAHHLKPVVRIGQKGITEQVEKETSTCLNAHELIKVHIHEGDRETRLQQAQALAHTTESELIHHIGKMFILYRSKEG